MIWRTTSWAGKQPSRPASACHVPPQPVEEIYHCRRSLHSMRFSISYALI